MIRRLALCADDYGLAPGVDDGVLRLLAAGRLTAVSCMSGAPGWNAAAAELARADSESFDAGLHFDLTQFPVIVPARSLAASIALAFAGTLSREQLASELVAQLDRFEAHMGRPPDHLDGHQHVHQLPGVRDVVLEVLERRYAKRLPWLRRTRPGGVRRLDAKAMLIERLGGSDLHAEALARGFAQNRHLLGVYDFRGDAARYERLLRGWLSRAVDGDLLLCHPAMTPGTDDAIAPARLREYAVLSSPAFAQALEQGGVRLVRMSSLLQECKRHAVRRESAESEIAGRP